MSSNEKDRVFLVTAGCCVAVVICAIAGRAWMEAPLWVWSGIRITPILALAQGYSLYPGLGEGPVHGWIYGPVAAFWYAPALLGATPSAAVKWAAAVNLVGAGVAVLIVTSGYGRQRWIVRLLVGGAMLLALAWIPSTRYWILNLNADVAAVVLSTAAIVMVARADGRATWNVAAGVLFASAALAKQPAAAVLVAAVALLWHDQRRRDALQLATAAITAGVAGIAACTWIWGIEGVWLNLLVVPSAHPPTTHGIRRVAVFLMLWVVPLFLALLYARRSVAHQGPDDLVHRIALSRLFTWAACFALPLGCWAASKKGGDLNSIHAPFYILAAYVSILPWEQWLTHRPRWFSLCLAVLALATTLYLGLFTRPWWRITKYPDDIKFARLQQFPGQQFFPYEPHLHLLAERVLYHSEYGLYDRAIAGLPIAKSVLVQHYPLNATSVIYPAFSESHLLLEAYPGFALVERVAGYDRFGPPAKAIGDSP